MVPATGAVAHGHEPHACPDGLADTPSFEGHVEHGDMVAGKIGLKQVLDHGEALFAAPHNVCDGQGRPATTGTGTKRVPDQPAFLRTSGPDSSACAGCHNQPAAGGGGDFVANVFVLAQALDPVTESVSSEFSNERNTLGMFGAGAIEMLAREMTAELQAQAAPLGDGDHVLVSKGVEFKVTIAGGVVSESRGVDIDLIVKPFHQAGVVRSIREFTVNAFNHHHGMQAEERFDLDPGKGDDFDEDGVGRELTIGDITAATLFQAALPVPNREKPRDGHARRDLRAGERLFEDIGCASCHVPALPLESRMFSEPNPLNPPGTFADAAQTVAFDMTRVGGLEKAGHGGAIVRAYTDLKRHNLCDAPEAPGAIRFFCNFFCNERLDQGRPGHDGRPGREYFLTRKLWDVGNSAPYGHRGDLTTIGEAILIHGGEGRASRDKFAALDEAEQRKIVMFLKTLKVDPDPGPRRHD